MKLLCAQVIKDILGGNMDVGVFKHVMFTVYHLYPLLDNPHWDS